MAKSRYKVKRKLSTLEARFRKETEALGLPSEFEAETFEYVITSQYTPDHKIGPKAFVETKGFFSKDDRKKIRAFVEQHPDIKLYLLFGNAENKIRKGSKTTYGAWATKRGIEWADIRKGIPLKWWAKSRKAKQAA